MFLVAVIAFSGCSMPVALVVPGQEPLVTEGKFSALTQESMQESMQHDEGSGFYYDFRYDRSNLYLNLAVADPEVVAKIAYFGFTVWIDRMGGKSQDQGFRFPTGIRIRQHQTEGQGGPSVAAWLSGGNAGDIIEISEEIDLIGIYGTSVRRVKMRDSRIRVVAEISGNILFYRAVIPYEVLSIGYDPLTAGSGISIGLETGHFEQPSASDMRRQSTRPGDMMGRPGGMTGRYPQQYPGRIPDPGMMERRSSEINRLSRPTRLWLALEFERQTN